MKLRTVSVVDALSSSLRDRVLNGEIDPGAGLTETEVAVEYEVSRPTARAAITQLVQEGILRRDAHRPARVPVLARTDIEDLFLVRVPLELAVVRALAERGGAPDAARDAVDDLAAVPPDATHSRFVEPDLRFHRVLVQELDSARLSRVYRSLMGEIHLSMVQSRFALGRDRIVHEHGVVLDAVVAGDAGQAVELMREHLEDARNAMIERLSETGA